MVGLKRISTVVGLLAVTASAALAQGIVPNPNQLTADAVASALRASRNLVRFADRDRGSGRTGDADRSACQPSVRRPRPWREPEDVAGVHGVIDQLQVANDRSILPAQYQPQRAARWQSTAVTRAVTTVTGRYPAVTSAVKRSFRYRRFDGRTSRRPGGLVNDGGPIPEGPAGMAGATQASMPGYPNYAWPSYAPYPNFSAVGYPTAYPWQAWPNIGPFYPYPEVPLDWRAVTLRWDDGIWWLDFKKHYTRPFFTPYPFGLFAY